MTDSGRRIYQALDQVRGLFEDVARLLVDCDRLMGNDGWKSADSTAIRGGSATVGSPRYWLPHAAHRIYDHEEATNRHKVIAVIFGDDGGKHRVEEPVVVGSNYYGASNSSIHLKRWDHTWWWLNYTKRQTDGSVTALDPSTFEESEFKKAIQRFSGIQMFAHLLVDIENIDSVEHDIIQPLIAI